METHPLAGLALAVFAGLLGGSVLMPLKLIRDWAWENTWLLYSACAYFLAPWLVAWATVPRLGEVYTGVAGPALLGTALFGLGWGVGVVLYGIAVAIVGLSLSSAIILGSSVALGSLGPLLLIDPERLKTPSGLAILAADAVMVLGVALCARAGGLREEARSGVAQTPRDPRFVRGLALCVISGCLSPLLNVAFTWGSEITKRAGLLGTNPLYEANAVWGLAVSMGALPSLAYSLWKLGRNATWSQYMVSRGKVNAALCVMMGVLFIISTVFYGSAAGLMGRFGPAVGWPIYLSSIILGNNFWGWRSGEWTGVGGRPVALMLAGIGAQIAAMALLGATQ